VPEEEPTAVVANPPRLIARGSFEINAPQRPVRRGRARRKGAVRLKIVLSFCGVRSPQPKNVCNSLSYRSFAA
jgi:hypothetical protein